MPAAGANEQLQVARGLASAGFRPGSRDRLLPKCRGVWLDRGELDKIVERSRPEAVVDRDDDDESDDRRPTGKDKKRKKERKKESFWSELFDF